MWVKPSFFVWNLGWCLNFGVANSWWNLNSIAATLPICFYFVVPSASDHLSYALLCTWNSQQFIATVSISLSLSGLKQEARNKLSICSYIVYTVVLIPNTCTKYEYTFCEIISYWADWEKCLGWLFSSGLQFYINYIRLLFSLDLGN